MTKGCKGRPLCRNAFQHMFNFTVPFTFTPPTLSLPPCYLCICPNLMLYSPHRKRKDTLTNVDPFHFIFLFSNALWCHTPSTVMQFVLTQTTGLNQHFNYLSQDFYNRRTPSSREDYVSCYPNTNSDEFLLLSLAFFFSLIQEIALPVAQGWKSFLSSVSKALFP